MNLRHGMRMLVVSVALLSACHKHPHPHIGDGSDASERPTTQVTIWENNYEAFIEYEFPAAGEEVRFITHISEISTGEPRREGSITIRLTDPGGRSHEHLEKQPARDGIYLPHITFAAPGAWKAVIEVPIEPEAALIHLPDIIVHESPDAANNATAPEEPEGISFLKEQQWKLSMLTSSVSRKRLQARRMFPGRIQPQPGKRLSISSPLAGRLIAPAKVSYPTLGQEVEAGQLLTLVEPSLPSTEFLALEVKLAEAEAEEIRAAQTLQLASTTLTRVQHLHTTNAKSMKELEHARYEAEVARVAHQAAVSIRKRYQEVRSFAEAYRFQAEGGASASGPLQLKAPISGAVTRINKSPGERVTPADDVFVILDAGSVFVEARVPEHETGAMGKTPRAYLELRKPAGETDRVDLELVFAGLEVDERTRTVPFVYRAENSRGLLRIGMSVDVFLESGPATESLAIPSTALVDEDGRYVAFVQIAGETFEKRELKLGARDRGLVEVIEGLQGGERVVTTDPWAIRLASLSTVIPAHGHTH